MYPEADGELANFICNLRLQAPYESLYFNGNQSDLSGSFFF
jgi:hypothetical protein